MNISNLSGNIYVNGVIAAAVEVPASIVAGVLLDSIGRKKTMFGSVTLAGICCLSFILFNVPADCVHPSATCVEKTALRYLAMVGKFGISASFVVIYAYAAELFPTVVRNLGMGISSQAARVGGIIAPLVVLLSQYSPSIPLLCFGVISLMAGALSLMLPETLGKPLYETLEEQQAAQALGYVALVAEETALTDMKRPSVMCSAV
eukprot:GILJ01017333.1.p1 GENE.GILJ01017333.1~~GILJ01017333.1.p1  ORF type:complete len:217 (+),score=24.32 GILJ01017333.1:39-653(+)